MFVSSLATDPEPLPHVITVNSDGELVWNVAVTVRDWPMFTTQNAVPVQPAPDQPVNVEPSVAVANRTTVEPDA
jgi:hypothetical protein